MCVNVSGFAAENLFLQTLDDAHVSVLTNRSVTRDAFSTPGFSGTPLDCSFVSLSAQQTLVELSLTFVVVAVESGKCFVLSKHSVFSTTASDGRNLQRLMLIVLAGGQHGPGDARPVCW